MDDSANPLYLHNSDHPGMVLVSQALNGENYGSWSRALQIALSVKNKLSFIDGTFPAPDVEADPQQYQQWLCSNNMVISWILNSVSKEITPTIIGYSTAVEIWNDLKERFKQQNGARLFQIKKDLINLQQGNQSVSQYYTRMKALWDEMADYRPTAQCVCGGLRPVLEHLQSEQVMMFLMGLNEQFAQARGQILLMEPIPPINKVFSLIIQEERQRSIGSSSANTADAQLAFAAKAAPKSKGQKKDRPICSHCGIPGHTVDKCFKIHGYPPGYKTKGKNSSHSANQAAVTEATYAPETSVTLPANQYQQLLALLASHLPQPPRSNVDVPENLNSIETGMVLSAYKSFHSSPTHWIVDSGATCHITNNIAYFTDLTQVQNIFV